MKRIIKNTVLVSFIIAMVVFVAACGSKNEAKDDTKEEQTEETTEETGEASTDGAIEETGEKVGDTLYMPEAGMTIDTPKTYLDNQDKVLLYSDGSLMEEGLYESYFYIYPATYEQIMTMSDEDYDAMLENVHNALNVYKVETSLWSQEDLVKWIKWQEDIAEPTLTEIGKDGDYTIYSLVNETLPSGLSEELVPVYEGIIKELAEAKDNIVYSEPVNYAALDAGNAISFKTTNVLDGAELNSQDIFSKNKYTVVNVWATWCGPCIQELPELETLSKELEAKGCGIMGILHDGNIPGSLEVGQEILTEAGVTYPNAVVWDGFDDSIHIQVYPTTYIVDSQGIIVGEAIMGADPALYMSTVEGLLGE